MKKLMIALPFTTLLASTGAFAGGNSDQGFYAGLDVGRGKPNVAAPLGSTLSKKSSNVFGGLLGYKFNKNLAVEGQFTGVGKETTTTGGTVKGDAFGVAAVGSLPMNDKFGVYGKLGYARTKTKTAAGFGATGASRSAPTYGVGVQYNVNPMLGVRLGVDRFGLATANAGVKTKSNADVTSFGVVFNF